jgi:hypothetical protein
MTANLEEVLKWAACSTGEGRRFTDDYYWTQPVKTALFRLTHYNSYFIGLIGLVGTGKSSAVRALETKIGDEVIDKYSSIALSKVQKEKERRIAANEFAPSFFEELAIRDKYCKKTLKTKWNEDLWTMFHNSIIATSALLEYNKKVKESAADAPKAQKLITKIEARLRRHLYKQLSDDELHKKAVMELSSDLTVDEAEKILPAKTLDKIRVNAILEFLNENVHTLLLDMPDYSQKGCWKINKDLDDIGTLWSLLKQNSQVNILVCLQQELVMKEPHLILGKMDKILLKTLTEEQLLEAYRQFFNGYEPFEEESLKLIAELSRGVFRRFKNYVRLSLETALFEGASNHRIALDLVRRAITDDQLRMDMDLELSDFFKNPEKKLQAFNILGFIRDNPEVSQKGISEELGIHPNAVGNLVRQLCLHNYLQVTRGKGAELLVSLKE